MTDRKDFQERLDRVEEAQREDADVFTGTPTGAHRDHGFWSTFKSILGDILQEFALPIGVTFCGGVTVLAVAYTFGIGFQAALVAILVVIILIAVLAFAHF